MGAGVVEVVDGEVVGEVVDDWGEEGGWLWWGSLR